MAEDRQTTLEAGEWKDCFMTIQVVCVFGGVGWLVGFFFFSPFNMTPPILRK